MNIALLGLWSALLGCTQEAPVSEQPMVVLVSIDTLRADHLSSYGYERTTSPFLDTLAESGTRFEYARSASPWTLPAHATMLTGSCHQRTTLWMIQCPCLTVLRFWLRNFKRKAGVQVVWYRQCMCLVYLVSIGALTSSKILIFSLKRRTLSGTVDAENIIDTALSWFGKQSADKPLFFYSYISTMYITLMKPQRLLIRLLIEHHKRAI